MKTLLFAVVSVMLAISAQARLVETPEQIQVRYGKPDGPQNPLETNSYTLGYTHAGYDIVVVFWNGKALNKFNVKLLRRFFVEYVFRWAQEEIKSQRSENIGCARI